MLLTLDTLTDVRTFRGAGSTGSLTSLTSSRASNVRFEERAGTSGGGPKISLPTNSFDFAFENCLLTWMSAIVSWLPLSSRCFATSGSDVGFFGERLPSSPKEI